MKQTTGKNDKFSNLTAEIKKKYTLHTSFVEVLNKIHGYASDEDGIRHSNPKSQNKLDVEEAKFILVTTSATINYIQEISNIEG